MSPDDTLGDDAPPSVRLIAMREAVREFDSADYAMSENMTEWTRVLADVLEIAAVRFASYEDALSEGTAPEEFDDMERQVWRSYGYRQSGEDPGEPDPIDLIEGSLINAADPETRSRYKHNDRYVDRLLKELDYHRRNE